MTRAEKQALHLLIDELDRSQARIALRIMVEGGEGIEVALSEVQRIEKGVKYANNHPATVYGR